MSREPKSGSIYVLRNRVNGKCYVGQTIKAVARRIAEHQSHPEMLIQGIAKIWESRIRYLCSPRFPSGMARRNGDCHDSPTENRHTVGL